MPKSDEALRDASLQDIPVDNLLEQFSDRRARNTPVCDTEYGSRTDDNALVLHFFPPGYGVNPSAEWPNWTAFRDALEQALLKRFNPETIDAGYVAELKSFYAILSPRPNAPDLTALLELFFSDLGA